jgi:hypothetical protein
MRAAAQLPSQLAHLAAQAEGGGSRRLTDHAIRMALAPAAPVSSPAPFAWSARTARRALGLAALRLMVAGTVRTPADGVRSALADAMRSARDPNCPSSTLDRWVSGLSAAGRAAVHADAVTWATRLWCALEWDAFSAPPIIGRDHWWESPHSSLLAIRSRADIRSVSVDGADRPVSVHLVLLNGNRRQSVRDELSVVAMVEAMRAEPSLRPGRVVGWWPDSGHLVSVDVDRTTLSAGVEAVRRALAENATIPAPFVPAA